VRERPHTRTRVTGGADVRKDELVRRENLPDRLEPGRVYRDVRVRRRISGYVVRPAENGRD
jgi:autonomous glycyl radical cofactor GrcA